MVVEKQPDNGPEPSLFEAGIFLVDKPVGPSSFAMVQQVRRALNIRKVGHSGTLDPFASGLLVICAGRRATRIIPRLMAGDKEYEAVLRLGIETDTMDHEGEVLARRPVEGITGERLHRCLAGFVGSRQQTPPAFSALKHKGKPLYYYARRGIEVIKEPRLIEITTLDCLAFEEELVTIRVVCGKGTYIRSLASDIGRELGCGAHLAGLRRLRNGPFTVADSIPGDGLAERQAGRQLLLRGHLEVDEVEELLQRQANA